MDLVSLPFDTTPHIYLINASSEALFITDNLNGKGYRALGYFRLSSVSGLRRIGDLMLS